MFNLANVTFGSRKQRVTNQEKRGREQFLVFKIGLNKCEGTTTELSHSLFIFSRSELKIRCDTLPIYIINLNPNACQSASYLCSLT